MCHIVLTTIEHLFILLNMCSASDDVATPHRSDLTAHARIRDTAIRLFGSAGYSATSVRAIAKAAGVSPALVIHHFGSKEALRRTCDEYVLDEIVGKGEELRTSDLIATMQGWLAEPDQFRPAYDYVARTLLEQSDLGATLFKSLVAKTQTMIAGGVERGEMRASSDPEMQALLVALHGLAPLVLQHQIGSLLAEPGLGSAVIRRMTLPTLELYTHGLYTSGAYLEAASAALEGGAS